MKKIIYSAVAVSMVFLTGCNTTGLDAKKSFSCKLGDTVDTGCKSISQVHAEVGMTPATKPETQTNATRRTPYSGMPIRTPIKVLRVWIAPWEDKDGDLRDQSYVYLTLNQSRWQIGHNQENIIDEYRPNIRLLGSGIKPDEVVKATDDQLPDLGLNKSVNRTKDPVPVMNKNGLDSPPNLLPPVE